MIKNPYSILSAVLSTVLLLTACNGEPQKTSQKEPQSTAKSDTTAETKISLDLNFDQSTLGKAPKNWQVADKESWQIIKDTTAPSGNQVYSMTDSKSFLSVLGGFNLTWTDAIRCLDCELSVKFKALTGNVDQGGGLVWRLQDKENYYVARFNPLEDNFRVYYVKNGSRSMIASVDIRLPKTWNSMKIIQKGQHFEAYLNDKKLIEGSDEHFSQAGGVGLWTKADAVTSFDDFSVMKPKRSQENVK